MHIILGIKCCNRENDAPKIQQILTDYGCFIDMRLGLHHFGNCSADGIILTAFNNEEKALEAEKKILSLGNTEVQKMKFKM